MSKVRVFIASSLDGFIAGPGDDLSWLPPPGPESGDGGFGSFLGQIGAILMGRRTYDVIAKFEPWPYGDRPVLVGTHRELSTPRVTVRAVGGDITDMIREARTAAADRDLYLDGGDLIRQALDAGLIDDIVVTLVPVVLGQGHPLFAGASQRHALELVKCETLPGGLVQLTSRPLRPHTTPER